MVGGYAIRYAPDHPAVARVTAIGRRKPGITHPKLNEVLHQDFANCSALAPALSGQDAAIFGLGTYTGRYRTRSFATLPSITRLSSRAFSTYGSSPGAAFSFLSGSGADQTGRSRMAFARYKGEAEKALLAAGFPRLYIFRPAYIYPVEPRKEPNFSYRLLRAIYPAFRVLFPNQVIPADDLARAMLMPRSAKREAGYWRTATFEPWSRHLDSNSLRGRGRSVRTCLSGYPVSPRAQQLACRPS
jgi:uncharacterized protein YbjT (DUF2867 family)